MCIESIFEREISALIPTSTSRLAIGVSGGGDSLALCFLLKKWCFEHKKELFAVTIDHQLRPESRSEALFVQDLLKTQNIKHVILSWDGEKPQTGIEEKAREARYNLLLSFCRKEKIPYLCLAHHEQDQAETFLSRLARGSGVDGLGGIHPKSIRDGIYLVRPLLHISKKELIQYLHNQNISWIEDPMNQDIKYERVRWRHLLPILEKEGLFSQKISLSADRQRRAQEALDLWRDSFFKEHVIVDNRGFIYFSTKAFQKLPDEIKIRVLKKGIEWIGGKNTTPVSLESLEMIIYEGKKRRTIGGCHIIQTSKNIFIGKEISKMEKEKLILANTQSTWDRFEIFSPYDIYIQAAGDLAKGNKKEIPFLIRQSFPHLSLKKELEKGTNVDYKKENIKNILIQFKQPEKDQEI